VEVFGPGACLERSPAVSITNSGDFTVSRDNPANVVVLPGMTSMLSASSSASAVTYQWFKDGASIPGATTASLTVSDTDTGVYYARVSLTGGSCWK